MKTRFHKVFGFVTRFWKRVNKNGPKTPKGNCWEWTASATKAGYGQLQCRKIHQAPLLAHRVSWELNTGRDPGQLSVLHWCDNPICIRPSHLFLGTQKDNNEDRDKKGRTAKGNRNGSRTKPEQNPFVRNRGSRLRGEQHPMAKLSDDQIRQILKDFGGGMNRHQIAKKYNITDTHANRIVTRISRTDA